MATASIPSADVASPQASSTSAAAWRHVATDSISQRPDDGIAGVAGLEAVPVGQCLCIHRPATGALAMLNGAAVEVWYMQAGRTPRARIVEHLAQAHGLSPTRADVQLAELEAAWRSTGVLDADDGSSAPRSMSPTVVPIPANIALDGVYGRVGFAARIRCDDVELGRLLAAVLAPLACPGMPSADILATGDSGELGSFRVWLDGTLVYGPGDRSGARREVLRRLLLSVWPASATAAILHASAVTLEGRTVLLAGPSGTGKSTFTAALVAAGGTFLADDLVPLDVSGKTVRGFPLALSVKSGSFAAVEALHPDLAGVPRLPLRHLQVRYLDLNKGAPVAAACDPALIVFPEYAPGADLEVEAIAPAAAFAFLIETGSEPEGTPRSIRPLVRLVERVPAYRIGYGDLAEAAATIRALPAR